MHYLVYRLPNAAFGGAAEFFLPLAAAVQYLEIQSELKIGFKFERYFIRSILDQSQREFIELPSHPIEMGILTADMIEMNRAIAHCPKCETYFTAAQITTLRWHEQYGARIWPPYGGQSGRQFSCTMGHLLLKTVEPDAEPASV